MTNEECKTGREVDVNKIVTSKHPKKIVVAGPGTGKSFLFQKLIKEKKKEEKSNFLAITFIGKLGDNLADDLCGLADWKVPIFLDTLSMGQLILPAVHYRRHF